MRSSKCSLVMILIASIAVMGSLLLEGVISVDILHLHRETLLSVAQSHKVASATLFAIIYATIARLSLPGAAIASIVGGFPFGIMFGTILNVSAATLGATVLYLPVRQGVRDAFVCRFAELEGCSKKIVLRLRKNEVSVLLSLRLMPAIPFFAVNLLAEISQVGLRNFVLTTGIGILPGAIVFASIGVVLRSVFEQDIEPDLSILWSSKLLFPLLGLAALSLIPIFLKNKDKPE